jgi:putative ABC transport system substrate-binding protein
MTYTDLGSEMQRRNFVKLLGAAAAAWPTAALTQQPERIRKIDVLLGFAENEPTWQASLSSFKSVLQRLGWIEGRNVDIIVHWTEANPDRARTLAAEIVANPADVIFVSPHSAAIEIFQRTHTIPMVVVISGDPVSAGFVKSYAHPAGNVTGFTFLELTISTKYFQLLKDIAPDVRRVLVMQDAGSTWRGEFREIEAVARSFAVQSVQSIVHDATDIERAITDFASEPNGGIILPLDATTNRHGELIATLAEQHRLPTVFSAHKTTGANTGLIYYYVDFADIFARSASYVDLILRGAKPADLPIQAPTKYVLAINLKTAKAIGLNVPQNLLIAADEVIE